MLDRLSQADRVSGASAAVALLATLLPWYRFDAQGLRISDNAFGTGFLGDVVFLCAAATLLLVLTSSGIIALRRPIVTDSATALFAVGCTALGAVVLQMLIGINGSGAFHSMTLGLVVELLATAGLALGGRLQQQASSPRHGHRI